MLYLGSTYIIVKNMEKSIDFYEKLLEMKVSSQNYDRWAQFNFDNKCIALFNSKFDERMIEKNDDLENHYDNNYLEYIKERKITYGNNMVLNFWIDDLKKERIRLVNLNIGKVSEIMYLNIASPYYMFVVDDPDGNTIEITGNYKEI